MGLPKGFIYIFFAYDFFSAYFSENIDKHFHIF